MALGEGDQLRREDLLGLGHEDLVQGYQEVVFALGREQLDRHVVNIDDPHHRDGLLDEVRVRRKIFSKIAHTLRLQLVNRGLDLGEVFLPDRHPRRLEDIAISLLTFA